MKNVKLLGIAIASVIFLASSMASADHFNCGEFHGTREGRDLSGCGRDRLDCALADSCSSSNGGHPDQTDRDDCIADCDTNGGEGGYCNSGATCETLCEKCWALF